MLREKASIPWNGHKELYLALREESCTEWGKEIDSALAFFWTKRVHARIGMGGGDSERIRECAREGRRERRRTVKVQQLFLKGRDR